MSYTPKSESELAKEGLLPDGTYDCEVIDTSDKPSKKGSDMYTLKLNVFGDEGGQHVYDYMVIGNHYGERKLRHAADAFNLIPVYETGNLKASDFMGKSGKVIIAIQDGNAEFPNPKNMVKDYVGKPVKESVATGALPPEVEGDDLPF